MLKTTGMLFDVYQKNLDKNETVLKVFREMNIKPTQKMKRINRMDVPDIKYVALVYDINSPIRKETIERRREIAAEESQFRTLSEEKTAMELSSDRVRMLVHLYIKHQGHLEWAALKANEDLYWQYSKALLSDTIITEADVLKALQIKTKIRSAMDETIVAINKYKDIIFGDNRLKEKEILNFSVEDFATALALAETKRNNGK